MWEYLARNLKVDVNILVQLNLCVHGNWCRTITQRSLYQDLFNQNDMDLVTEIFFCKTPVLDKKYPIWLRNLFRITGHVIFTVIQCKKKTLLRTFNYLQTLI